MPAGYKYEADPIKRREQRRARANAYSAKLKAELPPGLRSTVAPEPADAREPMKRLADCFRETGICLHCHREPSPIVAEFPEYCEVVADSILEAMDIAQGLIGEIGKDERFVASSYGDLSASAMLLIVMVKRKIEPISDSVIAHATRTYGQGIPLDAAFWANLFQKADNSEPGTLSRELEYLSYKIAAASQDQGKQKQLIPLPDNPTLADIWQAFPQVPADARDRIRKNLDAAVERNGHLGGMTRVAGSTAKTYQAQLVRSTLENDRKKHNY
jgi:hypothetical protein